MPSGKELLVLWLASTLLGGKSLLRLMAFVMARKLLKKGIRIIWNDVLQSFIVPIFNYFTDMDYSFLKFASKA